MPKVTGLLEGEDVLRTAAALNAMGAHIERRADGVWTVDGVGVQGLAEPEDVLDMGNSGTAARLLAGALAGLERHCLHDRRWFPEGPPDAARDRPAGGHGRALHGPEAAAACRS